jgi:hypothetical protein
MADEEKKGGGPAEDALFFIGFIVLLVVLWFNTGANRRADLRGIFIHPPQPVEQGGAYGPTVGSTTIRNR